MNSRGRNPREKSTLPTTLKGSNNANHCKQGLVQPIQGWPSCCPYSVGCTYGYSGLSPSGTWTWKYYLLTAPQCSEGAGSLAAGLPETALSDFYLFAGAGCRVG